MSKAHESAMLPPYREKINVTTISSGKTYPRAPYSTMPASLEARPTGEQSSVAFGAS
ncbi:hypothetical protein SH528x_003001 [Novipirellula sp. SH528]|uniref:hypothetical protein n=1 Tax=Novipirellula sp. SH528 TaxID=3454466 RepID=UPI003FA161B1